MERSVKCRQPKCPREAVLGKSLCVRCRGDQARSYEKIKQARPPRPPRPPHVNCPHGKRKKSACSKCNPCPHNQLKSNCSQCNRCPHGTHYRFCGTCTPCPHKKGIKNCSRCCGCSHGRLRANCSLCHPYRVAQKPTFNKIFRIAGVPVDNPRTLLAHPQISNELLEIVADGGGFPDWAEEYLEEKKAGDGLKLKQWARAVLTIRQQQKYRVSWRHSSTESQVFNDVFDFWDWVQEH